MANIVLVKPRADDRDQHQRDQDVGKRPCQIDDGDDDAFERAAEIAGGRAERHAERPSRCRWPIALTVSEVRAP